MKIAVVVASATGRTRRMADAFAEGARSEDAEVVILEATETEGEVLLDCDAVVLGCCVHMGGVASDMRAFLERLAPQWMAGSLAGKLGAAFVTSGDGARGGGELTLVALQSALAQHGMVIATMPNRTPGFGAAGCHWGPIAWTNPRAGEAGPTAQHLEAARAHGAHVARCTARWRRGEAG